MSLGAFAAARTAGREAELRLAGQGADPTSWKEIACNPQWLGRHGLLPGALRHHPHPGRGQAAQRGDRRGEPVHPARGRHQGQHPDPVPGNPRLLSRPAHPSLGPALPPGRGRVVPPPGANHDRAARRARDRQCARAWAARWARCSPRRATGSSGLDRLEQEPGPLQRTVVADLPIPAVPRPGRRRTSSRPRVAWTCSSTTPRSASIEHPLPDVTLDDYDLQTAVNLRAVFFLSQAAAEAMRPNGLGRIIAISSVGARTGGDVELGDLRLDEGRRHQPHEELRPQLRPHGITANAVAPGAVEGLHDRPPDRSRSGPRSSRLCRSAASPTRSRSPTSSASSPRTGRASSTAPRSTSTAAGSCRERRARAPARRHRRGGMGGLRPHPGLPAPPGGRAVDRQPPGPGGARRRSAPDSASPTPRPTGTRSSTAKPDIVALTGPGALRAEQAQAALEAGIHVLAEKPFTVDPADAWAIDRLARERGLPRRPVLRLERDGHHRARAPAHRGPGRDRSEVEHVIGRDGHDRPRPADRRARRTSATRTCRCRAARPGRTRRSPAAATARRQLTHALGLVMRLVPELRATHVAAFTAGPGATGRAARRDRRPLRGRGDRVDRRRLDATGVVRQPAPAADPDHRSARPGRSSTWRRRASSAAQDGTRSRGRAVRRGRALVVRPRDGPDGRPGPRADDGESVAGDLGARVVEILDGMYRSAASGRIEQRQPGLTPAGRLGHERPGSGSARRPGPRRPGRGAAGPRGRRPPSRRGRTGPPRGAGP